jgi:uncharacterized protein with ParB-like and HNH nuclease domain
VIFGGTKYIIPIYQRPYEWEEEQLNKFISSLFTSFWGNDGDSPSEPMFYGTMQLSKKNKANEQEVIDGQQRLSTILILLLVLKKEFPNAREISKIMFDWLQTRVYSGKQQEYLEKALLPDAKFTTKSSNPYQRNAAIIKKVFNELISDHEFDENKFITHLLSNVYFAVIETEAGLSKTLQIFNAINTTGLELNGADVFKIRMYEYLRDKKHEDESVWERISLLYKSIEDKNEESGDKAYSMMDTLKIYQHILIAKHKLPRVLYTYGTDTFFEQLFDTILKTNIWEHFKDNVTDVDLSLDDIKKIITIQYEYNNTSWETGEDACAMNFIYWSRYSRYSMLVFVFLYCFKDKKDCFHNMLQFMKQLSKVYTIYTIRFQKVVGEIHTFTYDLIEKILSENYEDIMNFVNGQIGTIENHKGWGDIEDILNGNITKNKRLKDIVCRLSAMLYEKYHTKSQKEIEIIDKKLFGEVFIDIEHIQASLDKDGKKREAIWEEWGDDLDSIGNLMVLEYDINRSIGNDIYADKIKRYSESVFNVVKEQPTLYSRWDLKNCQKRKEQEVEKILNYLFGM